MAMGILQLSVAVAIVSWCLYRLSKIGVRESGLPPGPPTKPLVGNALEVPLKRLHLKLMEFAKQYGKIYSLKLGTWTLIVLNDPVLIRELLERRSANTSDRPDLYVANYITGGLGLPVMRYGPVWRTYRRAIKDALSREASLRFAPIQKAEGTQFMYDLMKRPEDFVMHIQRYTASVILSVCFGLRCPRFANSFVSAFYAVERDFENIVSPGGAPPIDMFPFLRYVPERFAKWKTEAREIRRVQQEYYNALVELCKKRIQEERATGCYIEMLLENKEHYQLDEHMIGNLAGTLLEAGADTTSTYFQTLILLLTLNPDAQRKAQEELDRVVGPSRTPTLEDYENLPYINALIQEVHRIRPVLPLGLPHRNPATEMLDGFVIPKDSLIVANTYAIGHDENIYEDPERFYPERFLRSKFGTKPGVDDTARRHDVLFGYGRRMCPGMHIATNSMILNTMDLLWGFNFGLAKDPHNGEPIPIDVNNITGAVLLAPMPFKCDIRPRSERHAEVMRSEYVESRATFSLFEKELTDEERQYVGKW